MMTLALNMPPDDLRAYHLTDSRWAKGKQQIHFTEKHDRRGIKDRADWLLEGLGVYCSHRAGHCLTGAQATAFQHLYAAGFHARRRIAATDKAPVTFSRKGGIELPRAAALKEAMAQNAAWLLHGTPRFDLGTVLVTESVKSRFGEVPRDTITALLIRHQRGDWGDVSKRDRKQNDAALKDGKSRMHSVYKWGDYEYWIITDEGRAITTVLLPEDY